MNTLRQALLGLLGALSFTVASAHEIPNAVVVRLLARPQRECFQLLVRVPLSSMRDAEIPMLPDGYLDVRRLGPRLPDLATMWVANFVELYADGSRVNPPRVAGTQLSIHSDRSFESFERALAHVREPLPDNRENLTWEQVFFDVLLEYPIPSAPAAFALRPRLEHLAVNVVTSLEFHTPDGAVRPFQLHGDQGPVALDPTWSEAAWRFIQLGFRHIPDGADHVLFLVCLVLPVRRVRALIWTVTAFTLAHSITLIAATSGLTPTALWFPPFIDMLIAGTIVYTGFENIVGSSSERRRWALAFLFGLVHGFGFAFALKESLQFAGSQLMTALISFNVGVELGQLAVIAILAPVLGAVIRFAQDERKAVILGSALVVHTAWHWLTDRAAVVGRYEVNWTSFALRWIALPVVAAALAWWAWREVRRRVVTSGARRRPAE